MQRNPFFFLRTASLLLSLATTLSTPHFLSAEESDLQVVKTTQGLSSHYRIISKEGVFASASLNYTNNHVSVEMRNEQDQSLGGFTSSLFSPFRTYSFFGETGERVAEGELDFTGNTLTIRSTSTNEVLAVLQKTWEGLGEKWVSQMQRAEDEIPVFNEQALALLMTVENDRPEWEKTLKTYAKINMNGYQAMDFGVDPAPLLALLEPVRPLVANVSPTEADITSIMTILHPYIAKMKESDPAALQTTLITGYTKLVALFYQDTLTLGQKAALFGVLERFALSLA